MKSASVITIGETKSGKDQNWRPKIW